MYVVNECNFSSEDGGECVDLKNISSGVRETYTEQVLVKEQIGDIYMNEKLIPSVYNACCLFHFIYSLSNGPLPCMLNGL